MPNWDFKNLSEMVTNLIKFSELIKEKYPDEFLKICLFLETFISKTLNEFLQSIEKNENLDWMWINDKYNYIRKIISQFSKKIKSNKIQDFKIKLKEITAKVLESNKKESTNSENYSKFRYKWEIPNSIIEELKLYSPDLFFKRLIFEFDKNFKSALNTKESIFDHFSWFSIDENGKYNKNPKFICESISRPSQYHSLTNGYHSLISIFGLWFQRDENFQCLKDVYKFLGIEGTKNIFDNVKIFNHEIADLSIIHKLDNVLSTLLKENNQDDFELSSRDLLPMPLQFCKKIKVLYNETYEKTLFKGVFLFIWWLSCDPVGPNIRNKVAHPKQENNQYHYLLGILICSFVIGYILKLSNVEKIKKLK